MFPPEDAAADDVSLVKRVARWVDWWCAPRWRALLTWLGLTLVIGVAIDWLQIDGRLVNVLGWTFGGAEDLTGVAIPDRIKMFTHRANFFALFLWYEPLLLRGTFGRGLVWLALRIGSIVVPTLFPAFKMPLTIFLCAVLPVPVLWGWRTRPWMAVIGALLAVAVFVQVDRSELNPSLPVFWVIVHFPFAVTMIYGTDLLRDAERAGGSGVRSEPLA